MEILSKLSILEYEIIFHKLNYRHKLIIINLYMSRVIIKFLHYIDTIRIFRILNADASRFGYRSSFWINV